jgi:drug/metabolite transporter (DMT)-like permease
MTRAGFLYLLAAALFFSLMSVCVKLAGARLPTEEIILARAVVSLVLSYAVVRHMGLRMRGNARGLLVLRGVLGSCGLYCFFYAVTVLPLAEVTTIHYVNPILTAVLAALFLRERVTWGLAAAIGVSLAGVLVVARPQSVFGGETALDTFAVGVALAGALFSAAAYVTVRRLRTSDAPSVIVLYFPLVATPVFLPLALRVWVWPTPHEWLALLGVGVATQIAQVCLTEGLGRTPAGSATAVGYVQIAFAMLWSATIFDVVPDLVAIGGAGLVFCGIAILVLTRPRTPPPATHTPDRV